MIKNFTYTLTKPEANKDIPELLIAICKFELDGLRYELWIHINKTMAEDSLIDVDGLLKAELCKYEKALRKYEEAYGHT